MAPLIFLFYSTIFAITNASDHPRWYKLSQREMNEQLRDAVLDVKEGGGVSSLAQKQNIKNLLQNGANPHAKVDGGYDLFHLIQGTDITQSLLRQHHTKPPKHGRLMWDGPITNKEVSLLKKYDLKSNMDPGMLSRAEEEEEKQGKEALTGEFLKAAVPTWPSQQYHPSHSSRSASPSSSSSASSASSSASSASASASCEPKIDAKLRATLLETQYPYVQHLIYT